MAKSGKEKPIEAEILPDAWERFERAVDTVIKSGPKHKVAPKTGQKRKKGPSNEAEPQELKNH